MADENATEPTVEGGAHRADVAPTSGVVVEEAPRRAEATVEETVAVDPPRRVGSPADEAVAAERERLIAERNARREARIAALTPKPEPGPVVIDERRQARAAVRDDELASRPAEVVTITRRSTDGVVPSLGLFLLRLITAGIMGVHGLQKLLDLPAATQLMATTILPSPSIMAIVVGAAEVLIAIALVFGLLTRLAGLGVALIGAGALGFVLWGPWSAFIPGQPGFVGELELLLVGVGLLFLTVGAGGWSLDRALRPKKDVHAA